MRFFFATLRLERQSVHKLTEWASARLLGLKAIAFPPCPWFYGGHHVCAKKTKTCTNDISPVSAYEGNVHTNGNGLREKTCALPTAFGNAQVYSSSRLFFIAELGRMEAEATVRGTAPCRHMLPDLPHTNVQDITDLNWHDNGMSTPGNSSSSWPSKHRRRFSSFIFQIAFKVSSLESGTPALLPSTFGELWRRMFMDVGCRVRR